MFIKVNRDSESAYEDVHSLSSAVSLFWMISFWWQVDQSLDIANIGHGDADAQAGYVDADALEHESDSVHDAAAHVWLVTEQCLLRAEIAPFPDDG